MIPDCRLQEYAWEAWNCPSSDLFQASTGGGARMLCYRLHRQQDDGSWSVQEFQCLNDGDAIDCGLRLRTGNTCELYEADRWLATFDGVTVANNFTNFPANENTIASFVEIETEVAYFHRRALEEIGRSQNGVSAAAKLAHHATANYFESLARTVEAVRCRLTFYDVNSNRGSSRDYASF